MVVYVRSYLAVELTLEAPDFMRYVIPVVPVVCLLAGVAITVLGAVRSRGWGWPGALAGAAWS
jgi:hypothetical protein